jgi:hypothetical protein
MRACDWNIGMNKPEWKPDGAAVNDEALLADALEWLLWIERNVVGSALVVNKPALASCIADIRKRLLEYQQVGG